MQQRKDSKHSQKPKLEAMNTILTQDSVLVEDHKTESQLRKESALERQKQKKAIVD